MAGGAFARRDPDGGAPDENSTALAISCFDTPPGPQDTALGRGIAKEADLIDALQEREIADPGLNVFAMALRSLASPLRRCVNTVPGRKRSAGFLTDGGRELEQAR